jgi:predicted secreted protein
MNAVSAVAIYVVSWWICLFIVLPFGIRNAHEAGEVVAEGHDAGAPVRPMLGRKVAITTILATVVFVLIYWLKVSGIIGS